MKTREQIARCEDIGCNNHQWYAGCESCKRMLTDKFYSEEEVIKKVNKVKKSFSDRIIDLLTKHEIDKHIRIEMKKISDKELKEVKE